MLIILVPIELRSYGMSHDQGFLVYHIVHFIFSLRWVINVSQGIVNNINRTYNDIMFGKRLMLDMDFQ